ncbi:MAG: DEAD/DEAH box helicase family protein [Solobacterium sp.]|jgi:superfamily II DNA or RNA helicase|nr:DEAD/DEAH box helicase family protein [Solobacterium sp.]MCH4049410.1 DEAD/DEAH box helicase family protein [Solobacterium sp.]MCH4075266.1 DEAD/DEAH box helicase family protein [Solobacterium sp.]MCI1313821.1 DEAD/DEAH box helicase family protein [Solobacterium sp.]MCI1346196.1 DEAD/DEAH box helicase family protein [Solobacterium sp.]
MKQSVLTGGDNPANQLLTSLRLSIDHASGIDFIVSFLMESGVEMLVEDLRSAIAHHVPVRILTGNYLGITQPSALYLLKKEFGDRIDLRFYDEPGRSFHAKSYLLHYKDWNEIYVGSSNVSKSAFTSGIEWNYRFTDKIDDRSYQKFYNTFLDLFEHHAVIMDDDTLKDYADHWHKPALYRDLERYDSSSSILQDAVNRTFIHPRGAQIEALYCLDKIRKDGASCALVQAATGIGKTYLAAFDSRPYHRVLFIAHRHEIIHQAARSFQRVRPLDSCGFFEAGTKDTEQTMIFASVETLGRKQYLTRFSPDAFDYIVIDEFHHAVNDMYRNIMNYFHPKFLLGLTATPERMDGRDIYELCDYNVAFEIDLYTAINQGYLVPFHYYGIYDETDYDAMRFQNGHYREEDLNRAYIGNQHRYELIYQSYLKYPSKKALGFCASRSHAEDMAREFCNRGIPSAAVYSGAQGKYAMNREDALHELHMGRLKVLFSIDMFNEGLDVPDLDMVLFLRPTESPVIFLQQLGRGLRKADGKQYLNVLDFIGNYARASRAPSLLSGIGPEHSASPDTYQYPDDCIVDFDLKLIDLFRKMNERSLSVRQRIQTEVERVRDQIGHIPTRMDLFTYMSDDMYDYTIAHTKENPFRDYLKYLHDLHWLNEEEEEIYSDETAHDFLHLLETTSMSKVYKMPVLSAFYNNGLIRMEITDEQVLKAWKDFFNTSTNWRDLDPEASHEKYLSITDRQHLAKIHQMPLHFLLHSGNGFFMEKPGYALALKPELQPYMQNASFIHHFGDIIRYRTMNYYRTRYLNHQSRNRS